MYDQLITNTMLRDILLTDAGDVDFTADDLIVTATERTTCQHKRDILMAAPGDFKENPTLGADAATYIQDEAAPFLRNVRKQMQADGMAVTQVAFDGTDTLIIEGGYEND